ncbi:MAG: DEAD/DEAH box helicase family protein, partial [Atopostipes suicloacalis]|nr:DEAD/DEAH box helicase family protein [Atopostipes suicloacalis]
KQIENQFQSMFTEVAEVPSYIEDNLMHTLRPYQRQALRQFIFTQETDVADMNFNHLLFHMATGSGKTMVLAATMLYLFKENQHQNFLFFVNSDAIIKKTADNLLNTGSPKYLFNPEGIVIDGEQITIQAVDVFPRIPDQNTIYLKLTTIQKLHVDLEQPRENSVTYESLEDQPMVLLADEAHHINVSTKRKAKRLTKAEMEARTWETTVLQLLNLNRKNRLLEFTATINLDLDELFDKYRDKIVYQYDLKQFMADKYSKNVSLLRANEEDENKMLQAVLLSQYRKYIARDQGIYLKPVILFKSSKIATSQDAHRKFVDLFAQLTPEKLGIVIQRGIERFDNKQSIWSKMYRYYENLDSTEVVLDLQWDFAEENLLDANSSKFLEEDNALRLNTLEDPNNPFRAIFAVAKLNEGWDVLNLFDIVRISEEASTTRNTTDSEAQLIGRGARYYPFEYEEEASYTRRFDLKATDLKILETLHYHTINNNTYIKNLQKSLDEANIQIREDEYIIKEAKLKPAFKKTDLFKHGKIYVNKIIPTSAADYQTIADYNVETKKEIHTEKMVESFYGSNKDIVHTIERKEHEWQVERAFLQKGIQRNPFFRFSNLKEYMPAIASMKTFIESPDFLGDTTFYLSLPSGTTLTQKEKIRLVDQYLIDVERAIKNNYQKNKGTPIFEGVKFSDKIDDYHIEINKIQSGVTDMDALTKTRPMRDFDWYIYDQAIVNSWEDSLI